MTCLALFAYDDIVGIVAHIMNILAFSVVDLDCPLVRIGDHHCLIHDNARYTHEHESQG